MKNGIKTLAMWLILGIIFIVLLISVVDNADTKMSYSELIEKIENKEISEREISSDGAKAYVLANDSKQEKQVNIPNLQSFMEYVQEPLSNAEFKLTEKSQSFLITLLGLLSPFGLIIIMLIFF